MRKVKPILNAVIKTLYPPCCLSCSEPTEAGAEFCATCWPDTHFISGSICDACGAPVIGEACDQPVYCESCHSFPPAWKRGRAVALYSGPVRKMVLALKHGDRLDIAKPAARWMALRLDGLIEAETIVTAVPLHWKRLFRRRFNQASLIGQKLAKHKNLEFIPDALIRIRHTVAQKDMTRAERFENQRGAIQVNPSKASRISGKPVLIVDDVMTTGATLSACAEACLAANATLVNVIVLARVARGE